MMRKTLCWVEIMFYDKMDQRARLLPGEYRRKVAEVDRVHHGTTDGQVGPLQARPGCVFGGQDGAFGRSGKGVCGEEEGGYGGG